MATNQYAAWLGRNEERFDVIDAGPLDRLAATLDRVSRPARKGDILPPLAHWLFFLARDRLSNMGADGHAQRGEFLPPVHELPRRMWAGGRQSFQGLLRIGDEARRISTITSIEKRDGRSGPLIFVTVKHEISIIGGPIAITEEHDIVYRASGSTNQTVASANQSALRAAKQSEWRREVTPGEVMLFRYSALTFNSHRIHYDRRYAMSIEHYPGLVVHGPLVATLLIDLLNRRAGSSVKAFTFRGVSPAFDGDKVILNGIPADKDGRTELWAESADGRLIMQAEAFS